MSHALPRVLFLCTGNSCRSQMAEGFARRLLAGRVIPYSAGVDPHGMNPRAMQVMVEAGFPIDDHHSKHVRDLAGVEFDYVITVCGHADEACPVLPGPSRRIHRGFDDPPRLARDAKSDDEALPHYRRVRDEIKTFISTLDSDTLARLAGK
jgi:arsenate reductase (thioredoxin)